MPTIRYQIRNEYGLADPELYRAADKDDPEAVLEGVAMAGLVGVLRQLGDLAEFAAEIFRDLHEEVTTTAARGHGLMLRVQQLEAEFPSIEKAFLFDTSHSRFACNEGIDWHANLRTDQNLVTQGDMPRFILDSYEECRGPPRLFMLDKFDVAGAGACLKRYSDPSSLKVEFASSGMMEEDNQREKKTRKIKKKGFRWRNGETLESFLAQPTNSNSDPMISDQVTERVPMRHIKLKPRNLINLDTASRRSYMKHLLRAHLPEQDILPEKSTGQTIIKSINSSESASEIHEAVVDAIADSPVDRGRLPTQSPIKHETTHLATDEWKQKTVTKYKTKIEVSVGVDRLDDADKSPPALLKVDQKKSLADINITTEGGHDRYRPDGIYKTEIIGDGCRLTGAEHSHQVLLEADKKKPLTDAKFLTGGLDDYRPDDTGSDQENFMDALNTMESEIETDTEGRVKSDPGVFHTGSHEIDSDFNEKQQELPTELSEPDSVENPTVLRDLNYMLKNSISSLSNSDTSSMLSDKEQSQENVSSFDVPAKYEIFHDKSLDKTSKELQRYNEVGELTTPVLLVPSETTNAQESNIPFKSETAEAPSGSCDTASTSSPIHACPQGSDEAAESVSAQLNETFSDYVEGTREGAQQLDSSMKELPNSANNSDYLLDLSDVGDSKLGRKDIPGETHFAELADVQKSKNMSLETPDHPYQAQKASIVEEVPTHYVEDLPLIAMEHSQVDGQQGLMEQMMNASSGGSISSVIPAFSPEVSPTDGQPDDLTAEMEHVGMPEEFGSDIASEGIDEISRHLDGKFPYAGEISELPSQASDGMAFPEPAENSVVSSDALLLVSDIPEKHDITEYGEETLSKDIARTQGQGMPEVVQTGYIGDSLACFTEHVGDWQEPGEQDNKDFSGGGLSPSNSSLSLGVSPIAILPYGLSALIMNVVAAGEDSSGHDVEERDTLLPNTVSSESEHFSNVENLQEPCDVDSGELLPLCSEKGALPSDLQLQSTYGTDDVEQNNTLMPKKTPLELEHFSNAVEKEESCDMDSVKLLPLCLEKVEFPDGMEQTSDKHNSVVINGPDPIAGNLGLPSASTIPDLHDNALPIGKLMQEDDSLAEYVIVDPSIDNGDLGLVSTPDASSFDLQLQENYVPRDEGSDEQSLEISRASSLKDMTVLHKYEEHPVPLPTVSSSDSSSYSSDAKLLDGVCHAMSSEQSMNEAGSVHSQECEHTCSREGSTDFHAEHAILLEETFISQAVGETIGIHSHQDGEHLVASDLQYEIPSSGEQHNSPRMPKGIYVKPSEPKPSTIINNGEINQSDMLLSNTDIHEQLESGASIASRCILENSVGSLSSSISTAELLLTASSDPTISETGHQESSESHSNEPSSSFQLQDVEEKPPLPPLPPLEWRMGKLRLGSLIPGGDIMRSSIGTNPFLEPPTTEQKHPQCSVTDGGQMVQSPSLFESLPVLKEDRFQHGFITSEEEFVQPLKISEFPPIVEDSGHQVGTQCSDRNIVSTSDSFLTESSSEDEKYIGGHGTLLPALEGGETQHHHLLQREQVHSVQDNRPQLGQLVPSLELERSQHEEQHIERDAMPLSSPFLAVSSTEEWKYQYGYGVYGGEDVTGPNLPPYGFLYPMGENQSATYDFMASVTDGERPHWKRSIRDRPRDPLIEAVAAHDKSTLRKVSEVDRPSARPKEDERDSLLDQIRNKSFNLKPAASARPNVKGPPTNLKVAAILEKANAIRQAFVGSDDEDDDGDRWSDT